MNRNKSESEQMLMSKASSNHDLVELFECISSLCKVNSRNRSFDGVHLSWKRFWSEVAKSMSKSLDALNHAPLSVSDNRQLASRGHLYSISTIHRYSRSPFRRGKDVPFIRLSGLWLEAYGFKPHGKFEVYPEKNQLILRLVSAVDPDGLPLPGSSPSCQLGSDAPLIGSQCNVRWPNG